MRDAQTFGQAWGPGHLKPAQIGQEIHWQRPPPDALCVYTRESRDREGHHEAGQGWVWSQLHL